MPSGQETERLQALWAGEFGDDYVERNKQAGEGRDAFWKPALERLGGVGSAVEIGCNVGGNLRWIAEEVGGESVAGIDINAAALEIIRELIPGVDARQGAARSLPWDDSSFDLAFTMGVLIHQPQEELDQVMSEVVRVSRKYVLCGEYYSDELEEIPYRGQTGALFKRDFGGHYQELFPDLELVHQEFLAAGQSAFDDVTVWVFQKGGAS